MATERTRGALASGAINVGNPAPDFELPAVIDGVRSQFRLSTYRGQKNVVLAFYPFNWQEASARQLQAYQAQRSAVLARATETVAISVDSIMNTATWEREIGPIAFPLCSDFWPHGEVCARYGVLRESGVGAGASERAVFVVNRGGQVVFRKICEWEEVPRWEETLEVLERL